MIGDTPYDIEAGRKAGVGVVAFRTGGWPDVELRGAVAIDDGPADLVSAFETSPFSTAVGHVRTLSGLRSTPILYPVRQGGIDGTGKDTPEADANRDPITGAPGAHPVGVGVGATGGATVGAAIGSVGGVVGAAVGAVVGGVVGGLAGKGAAEAIDPTVEDEYWRAHYSSRPYVASGSHYDTYQPAYRYGWESYNRFAGRPFDEVEAELQHGWEHSERGSTLTWDEARHATRDAWHRVERERTR